MSTVPKVNLLVGDLSVSILKLEESVRVSAFSGRYKIPNVEAFNLRTALWLLKGWFTLTTSYKERSEFNTLIKVMEEELGGELMSGEIIFFRYGEENKLSTSLDEPNTWILEGPEGTRSIAVRDYENFDLEEDCEDGLS